MEFLYTHLPVVDFSKLGIKGLCTGSSTLTGEEKSEQPRPSELTGIDPSLRLHSLSEKKGYLQFEESMDLS